MQAQRVLITGGAGLIGSHIADALVQNNGCDVVILDNFVRGTRRNLARAIESGRVTIVEGDLRDRALLDRIVGGVDVIFHQAAIRITQCARNRGWRWKCWSTAPSPCSRRPCGTGCGGSSRPRRPRSTAWRRCFPPPRTIIRTTTARSTARRSSSTKACCAAFNDMYGLSYVALRYFNVYGPRMDVHGAYTEVLVRWMERIAAGQPPLIFGDGTQTMDFVHVGDIARANILAASADVDRRGLQHRQRPGNQPERAGARRSWRSWVRTSRPSTVPARKVNPVPRRLADVDKARRAPRLRITDVAGGRSDARLSNGGCRSKRECPPDGSRFPSLARRSDRRNRRGHPRAMLSGWLTQGPEVAAFEREFAEMRRRGPCVRRLELHDGVAPGAARRRRPARATKSSR